MSEMLEKAQGIIWGPWTAALVLGAGIFFTLRSRFYQVRMFPRWWRATAGSMAIKGRKGGKNDITQFQGATAVLAGTLGTGNIVGVATALTLGGPGAIFWMWIAAFFGMMISYFENALGMLYRRRDSAGKWRGGPMFYMEKGLGKKWLAIVFALSCAACAFGVGNLTQINSIAHAAESAFGAPRWATGLTVAAVAAPAVIGGVTKVVKLTEKLIPFIAAVYILACLAVILLHLKELPGAVGTILRGAFSAPSIAGGALGGMLVGVRRGLFTNEAGMGSSVLIHCEAGYDSPEQAGMWGIFEVFIDTIVMCTLTALAILMSGALSDVGPAGIQLDGAALSSAAFSGVLGRFSGGFITGAILLFAFATIVAWSCLGVSAYSYLFGHNKSVVIYKLLYIGAIILGAVIQLRAVWAVADILNGLMLLPNLIAVLALSGEVFERGRRQEARDEKL